MGFKKLEVRAYSIEDAIKQAPFKVIKNATIAWGRLGHPLFNGFNEFAAEYLTKFTKNDSGLGCVVCVSPGKGNSRMSPCEIENVKNVDYTTKYIKRKNAETGEYMDVPGSDRLWKRSVMIVDNDTNQLLCLVDGHRKEGKKAIKELYRQGYTGNATAYYIKTVKEGEPISFTTKYKPSKATKMGTYILFGIE